MRTKYEFRVNKVFAILKEAAKYFDNNYDVEIFEAHHRDKLDAPSGTALKMGLIIADTLGLNLKILFAFEKWQKNKERTWGNWFFCGQGGDIVGQHKVIFAGNETN